MKIEIRFPSAHMFLGVPDAVIQELGSELPFSQTELDELSTSVIEACTNAMEHGNGMHQDNDVRLELAFNKGRFEVTVFDHGGGFDFENVDPSKEPADLFQERGRGLFIIHSFCDEVSFFRQNGDFAIRLVKVAKGEAEASDA